MTRFDPEYFRPFKPTKEEIQGYLRNAERNLSIARQDSFVEVRFTYAYQALIKAGIALLAHRGHVKVRSIPGHHVQLLSKMSELLHMPDVETIGNAMRTKRNLDLYEGGTLISEKGMRGLREFCLQNRGSSIQRAGSLEVALSSLQFDPSPQSTPPPAWRRRGAMETLPQKISRNPPRDVG